MLSLALAAAALAQDSKMVDPADPASVIAAMQDNGYRATLDTDSADDPLVVSGANGATFVIFFFGCEEHKNCKTLQFVSSYDFEEDNLPDPMQVHKFDSEYRFTRSYLDEEGDPVIEMDVQVPDGPITREVFDEALNLFTTNMALFQNHIGWN